MKAILTYSKIIDGKSVERTQLFDTAKAIKICDVTNIFGCAVQEIYITDKGTIFTSKLDLKKIEVPDQKSIKAWIGEHEPDKYVDFFGEVEEG